MMLQVLWLEHCQAVEGEDQGSVDQIGDDKENDQDSGGICSQWLHTEENIECDDVEDASTNWDTDGNDTTNKKVGMR